MGRACQCLSDKLVSIDLYIAVEYLIIPFRANKDNQGMKIFGLLDRSIW